MYVGTDKKIHFVNGSGADSVLNFSSIQMRHTVTVSTPNPGQYLSYSWIWKILPATEVTIVSNSGGTINLYSNPANVNLNLIQLVSRNSSTGVVTFKNRTNYPLTITPNGGTAFIVAANANFDSGASTLTFAAEYISQNVDDLRSICTSVL